MTVMKVEDAEAPPSRDGAGRAPLTGSMLPLLLALVAFAAYLPALENGFVNWDDPRYVLQNLHIRSLDPRFFKWVLTAVVSGNWHPMTMLSLALDYAVWGLNPLGYHLSNNILHALNTALVFTVTTELAGRSRSTAFSTKGALIAGLVSALLFAIHPVHVESVAWVSERKDVLSAFFFLLSVLLYLRYTAPGASMRGLRYFLSLFAFILALMSKPMAVSLPLVLLIMDFYPAGRLKRREIKGVILEKIPFFVLAVLFSIVTYRVQRESGAVTPFEIGHIAERLVAVVEGYAFYLYKIVLPLRYAPLYPSDLSKSFSAIPFIVAIVAFLMAVLFIPLRSGVSRALTALWLYYLVTLLPVIGIVQVGTQGAADRYAYLPGIALFLAAGLWAGLLFEKVERGAMGVKSMATLLAALVLFSALTLLKTESRIGVWKDSLSLWNAEISFLKDFPDESAARVVAFYNRGHAYYQSGRDEEGLRDFSRVIALNPRYVSAYVNRGAIYGRTGKPEKAISDFSIAIRLDPLKAKAYYNRGLVYKKLGDRRSATRDFRRAGALGKGRTGADK